MARELEQALYDATLNELLARIKSGEATAADMANALKFLKDNGIQATPEKKGALRELAEVLPFKVSNGSQ